MIQRILGLFIVMRALFGSFVTEAPFLRWKTLVSAVGGTETKLIWNCQYSISIHHFCLSAEASLWIMKIHPWFLMYGECRVPQTRCGGSRDLCLGSRAKPGSELCEEQWSVGHVIVWMGWEAGKHEDVSDWINLPFYLLISLWLQLHALLLCSQYPHTFPPLHLPGSKQYQRKLELLHILVTFCL